MRVHRFSELPKTPRGPGGWPLRLPLVRDTAERIWDSQVQLPWVASGRRRIAGVDLVAATFLVEAGVRDWIVHLANITDRHRESLQPSRLLPIPGTGLAGGTFLLPADGMLSYRLADVTGLPEDIGCTRQGWREVHRRGIADPRNPRRMPTPMGGQASIWLGPTARWREWPETEVPGWVEKSHGDQRVRVLRGDERVLVVFDAEHWEGQCLGAGLRSRGIGHTVVLVDSGPGAVREARLTNPDAVGAHLQAALSLTEELLGRSIPQADVVAGQSFGGLAVAWLLATHPTLLRAGVVQSGSFWHGESERDQEGELLRLLRRGDGEASRPVVIQVGSEEDSLLLLNRQYRDLLCHRGALHLGYREIRGGHDYAWWRCGLVSAVAELASG